MSDKYGPNALWADIGERQINEETTVSLENFKTSEVNYRIALFNVATNGGRYLKTLIYNLASELSPTHWTALRNVRNRDVGDPVSVRYNGETVDLDYVRAVRDLEFISAGVDVDAFRILEIGAGYGRTCHTILSNHDIAEYWILDLAKTLDLSRRYLSTVLDDELFAKVRFVAVDDIDVLDSQQFDLCVNIDSLAEMDVDTVQAYLALIDAQCRYFYVNNPVGKYMDKTLDGHARGEEAIALALSPGLLTDVIDIHDNGAVEAHSRKFVAAYRPGGGWRCVSDAWSRPFSHYWQALYRSET
ncbi:putative sugar O-methyltransferase [Streptomyces sp. ST2-7A]|uniref:putative sugar O-methyltransferase n=1 Tax=Streptomyces sp. ST2-7A TaxID=2907214 RepID=UPI001F2F697F|nr:putative sugar O-methyltransferase [Streptomyces sp. ST2-7A]MCE7083354.1 putative sugar O-methyltransferase [Streptomyces sp. ST2-7A]